MQYFDSFDAGQIARGHPFWPDGAMYMPSDATIRWVDCKPYYRAEPFTRLLVNSVGFALREPTRLPMPDLAKDNNYSHLARLGLAEEFKRLQAIHAQFGEDNH